MGKRRSQSPRKSAKAQKWKYQLSIGIIFKNEIRCLERCLTSLLPLKKSLSCEIVMADTGSTDGSREIAEKYADILFDFPWINDFAAARNAVLERCSGEWLFYVDCDEWLEDVTPLTRFLNGRPNATIYGARLTQRNYSSYSSEEKNQFWNIYSDLLVYRMVRMSAMPHFEGAIHERLIAERPGSRISTLQPLILHHDGYVCLNDGSAEGEEKRQRNLSLLRIRLKENPKDLRAFSEFADLGRNEPDYLEHLRQVIALIREKAPMWQQYGPLILSRAIVDAWNPNVPEIMESLELAEKLFPDSYFVRIDINGALCSYADQRNDFAECIRRGKAFLAARRELTTSNNTPTELLFGCLQTNNAFNEKLVELLVLRAVACTGDLADLRDCVKKLRQMLRETPELANQINAALSDIRRREQEAPPDISPELRELAEKVRAILAAYPPDDPEIVALKATPVYQRVAHLL